MPRVIRRCSTTRPILKRRLPRSRSRRLSYYWQPDSRLYGQRRHDAEFARPIEETSTFAAGSTVTVWPRLKRPIRTRCGGELSFDLHGVYSYDMDTWRTAIATSDDTHIWIRGYDVT